MHSFISCLMPSFWANKERRPPISPDLQQHLWPKLGGTARENKSGIFFRPSGAWMGLLDELPATNRRVILGRP